MKKLTKEQRAKLAAFHQNGGDVTDQALSIVQDVQWMDEANNLAIDVAARCKGISLALRAVLRDRRATRVFLANLRRRLKPSTSSTPIR